MREKSDQSLYKWIDFNNKSTSSIKKDDTSFLSKIDQEEYSEKEIKITEI
jgi:hypothetical protein